LPVGAEAAEVLDAAADKYGEAAEVAAAVRE